MNLKNVKQYRWLLLFVAVFAVGLGVGWMRLAQGGEGQAADAGALTASGIIEATTIEIASEFGGRIAAIPVAEATRVSSGSLLVQLDTALLDAEIDTVAAQVAMAEAGLAQAQAGARPGQIETAAAQLAQAEAGRVAARQAVSDTAAMIASPQEIDLQIAVTQGRLAAAQQREARAVAQKDAVEAVKAEVDAAWEEYDGGGRERFLGSSGNLEDLPSALPGLPEGLEDLLPDLPDLEDGVYTFGDYELHITGDYYELYHWVNIVFPLDAVQLPNLWWQSWVGVNAATAEREGVAAELAHLYKQREHPQEMQEAAAEARSVHAQTEAQVAMAEAQLAGYRAGATAEQIAVLEAQAAQARAGLAAMQERRAMMALTAPITGAVAEIFVHPGEVVAAGAGLLSLADLDDMTLTVYVPQTRLGHVYLRQPVRVHVDSFPNRVFAGQVSHISDQAEFTPRNIATKEERVNLVFAIQIQLDNTSGLLKPGMPADATFEH